MRCIVVSFTLNFMRKSQKFYLIIKKIISIIGSFVGILFCFSLFWWWIFIINLIVTKGHPVFCHVRTGKNGKEFKLLKFRSMRLDVDPNLTSEEIKKIDNVYICFGKFLRKTSLDETLQLLNVFIGQMCFIGPRPLIDKDDDHITIERRKENGSIKLTPGISGYAQINGRIDISPIEKADLDGYYYEHISLWLDIKIFVITVLQVFHLRKNKPISEQQQG